MQRILHINDYPISFGGGAEVVMDRTIALLRGRGFHVETFTVADLADPRLSPLRYVHNVGARRALAEKLDRFCPDVVHLHNFYHVLSPAILAELEMCRRRRPLRVVMTAHDYHLVCPNSGGNCFQLFTGQPSIFDHRRMASAGYLLSRSWDHRSFLHSGLKLLQHVWSYRWRQLHRAIDLVICPSRFVQEFIDTAGLKSCFVPHPAAARRARVQDRNGSLQMVFAGRVEPEKGLDEFLELWPDDLQAYLSVIGTGQQVQRCQQTCVRRGLTDRVRFLGRLSHEQTMAEIGRSHLLVFPSRVLETYGLVLIEAIAAGTNVLAANRGAAAEIVTSARVGFLYELDNAASLRRQLQVIEQQHADQTLNAFDPTSFLAGRSEARYVTQLIAAYRGDRLALAA